LELLVSICRIPGTAATLRCLSLQEVARTPQLYGSAAQLAANVRSGFAV